MRGMRGSIMVLVCVLTIYNYELRCYWIATLSRYDNITCTYPRGQMYEIYFQIFIGLNRMFLDHGMLYFLIHPFRP